MQRKCQKVCNNFTCFLYGSIILLGDKNGKEEN